MHMQINRPNPDYNILPEYLRAEVISLSPETGRPIKVEAFAVWGDPEDGNSPLASALEEHVSPVGSIVPYQVFFTYAHCGHHECQETVKVCLN